jgi:hypothetical protein
MEFYAVSELLIADKPYICGIEIGQWERWASQYKVAKVHRITKDSPCGKRFFNDVQVAGFLLRELEFLEDSPGYVSETVTYLDSEKTNGRKRCVEKVDRAWDDVWQPPNSLPIMPCATDIFFKWLVLALQAGRSDADMVGELIAHTRYLLLEPDGLEPLTEAKSFLDHFDTSCADQLETRWHAAHYAESPEEAAIASSLVDVCCSPTFAPIMRTDSSGIVGSPEIVSGSSPQMNATRHSLPQAAPAMSLASLDVFSISDIADTQRTHAPVSASGDVSDGGSSEVFCDSAFPTRSEPGMSPESAIGFCHDPSKSLPEDSQDTDSNRI